MTEDIDPGIDPETGEEIGPPLLVTLCGSMTLFAEMLTVAAELTDRGYIVLAPFRVVAPAYQDDDAKARLDALHRRKISLSDLVVVVTDEVGRIGESTRAEIAYARRLGLPVEYQHRPARGAR